MFIDLLRLVVQDLWRKKFSSLLTLFAISLGILSIFLIILLGMGFENSIEEQFEIFGANRLYVLPQFSGFGATAGDIRITDSDVEFVRQRSYIDTAFGYFTQRGSIRYGNEERRANLFGTDVEGFITSLGIEVEQGRLPRNNERNVVVLGSRAATDIFSRPVRIGTNIEIRGERFKVIGILESIGNPEDDNQFYFNIDALRDVFGAGDRVEAIEAIVVQGQNMDLAQENLQAALDRRFGRDRVSVITPEQILNQLQTILGVVQATLGGIALVSLLVGALGIVNTMYVIVTEKTKDIGIMKSIGAKNSDILFMFTTMAGLFGLLGAILGIAIGSVAAIGFQFAAQSAGFDFLTISIEPLVVLFMLFFGILIGIVAGFLPSLKASRLTIIDTLRK